ncbi:hypothetical protein [Thalassotalea sp. PLHSN55]|uniref:hypothetical protein n=1 Tax=Thalassotalea sp. PLHSN55 TaxID=3435888 RepID=UPI003F833333
MEKWTGKERRKSADNWQIIARILSIGGWLTFIIALIVSYYAAPEKSYGLLRYHHIEVRSAWLTPLTGYLFMLLLFSGLSSYASILINKYRQRRSTDNTHFNVVLLLLISIAWAVYISFHIYK